MQKPRSNIQGFALSIIFMKLTEDEDDINDIILIPVGLWMQYVCNLGRGYRLTIFKSLHLPKF